MTVLAKKKSKQTDNSNNKKEWILLLPILFFVTVFLFCVRGRIVPSYVSELFWYNGGAYTADLYAYFRMQLFTVITIVFTLYMIYCIFAGKVKLQKHKVYIPMAVYALLVIVSYLLSDYKEIAFLGYQGRYEGTVTLLCYMLILFYAMHAVLSEKGVKLIVKCFSAACVLLGIWGVMQVFGFRLDSIPEALYIPASMREAGSLNLQKANAAVNWFFSNQNYSSFFMIFPVCLFAMSCIGEENMKKKIAYAVLTGLMLFNLFQSASLGGMVGIAVSVVVAFIIAGMENIMKWKKSLGLLVLAAVVAVGASMPVIMKEVNSGMAKAILGIEEAYAAELEALNASELMFTEIEYIITDGADVVFGFTGEEVRIATKDGEVVSVQDASGTDLAPEKGLLHVSVAADEASGTPLLYAETMNKTWIFALYENEAYHVAPSGKLVKLDKVERMGFEGNEDFATYRGYIWSRTLPLVKENLIFGKGADTFILQFPHEDFAGRYNIDHYTDDVNIVIDKPHNMYLGTAVNTGVISAVALAAVYLIYLIESIRTYRKHTFNSFKDYIGMGIAVAVAGFMVAGLVNDSTVQMMPVVYALIGAGFAVNRMVKEEKE